MGKDLCLPPLLKRGEKRGRSRDPAKVKTEWKKPLFLCRRMVRKKGMKQYKGERILRKKKRYPIKTRNKE